MLFTSHIVVEHGRPQGRGKTGICPPWKLRLKDQKFLDILKSATSCRLLDLILAMTVYLPVWHPHCIRLQRQTLRAVAEVASGCSTVGLYYVTITWSQIFKGSLRVNGSRRFACVWLLNQGLNEVRWRPGQEASLAPHLRTWGLPVANVLYWRICLWHCWDFSATRSHSTLPAVIYLHHSDSVPGELCPPCPVLVTPLCSTQISCQTMQRGSDCW